MKNITIENTSNCGANCVMCPREQYTYPKAHMEQLLFEKIIRQVYEAGVRQVDIGGYGDPLIDPGLKEKILFIKSSFPEIRITTISTGQFLCGEIADIIAENVEAIKISNYGLSKKVYEMVHRGSLIYEQVKNNILDFLGREKRPCVTMAYLILQNINEDETEKWKSYWEGMLRPSDNMQIWYPHNYAGAKREFDNIVFSDKADISTCKRPGNDFMFCANGDVNACCFDFNHKLTIGNILNEDFNEIMSGIRLREIVEIHNNNAFEGCGLICEYCDQILNRKNALYYSKDKGFRVGEKSLKCNEARNE